MHPTGSHARSSDVILRSYYAYSWHINSRPAGDLERYEPIIIYVFKKNP
jgi:hypothetical protein